MPVTDIVAFIAARLDEREALAKAASAPAWCVGDPLLADVVFPVGVPIAADSPAIASCMTSGGGYRPGSLPDAAHIAANDPAYVLADIAAKRRILARHSRPGAGHWGAKTDPDHCVGCGYEGDVEDPRTSDINQCPELLDLAAVVAGHEGRRHG